MPLDSNLLYGEMAGSSFAHVAIAFGTYLIVNNSNFSAMATKIGVFLAIFVVLSFVCQYMFLAMLQANSCDGVKDYGKVFTGAMISAIITAGMVAVPAYVEPLRLVVSRLGISHKTLLSPKLAVVHETVANAAVDVYMKLEGVENTNSDPVKMAAPPSAITAEKYDVQTLQEIACGAAYWGAFAGAYGVGIGSLTAATCPATK